MCFLSTRSTACPRVVEEILYPAMEDFKLDLVIGEGPAARTVKIDLPPFTLVGATTRAGLLTAPLRGPVRASASDLTFTPTTNWPTSSPVRPSCWPCRSSRRGCWRSPAAPGARPGSPTGSSAGVRDFAQVEGEGVITRELADYALKILEVDHSGLDGMDRAILRTIIDKYAGGPVGMDTMATAVGEEKDTLEEVYEPFLIQQGFIKRTPRGRVATKLAHDHLGRPYRPAGDLFE